MKVEIILLLEPYRIVTLNQLIEIKHFQEDLDTKIYKEFKDFDLLAYGSYVFVGLEQSISIKADSILYLSFTSK